MPNGRVTHAESGGVHVFRYFGRVNYVLAPAIKQFADELVNQGDVRGWVFDLTQAEILDSTNLGLLARLAARAGSGDEGPARSIIVSASDDMNSVLRSMRFDQLFDIVSEPAGAAELAEGAGDEDDADEEDIRSADPSAREVGQTMLDAHRALMALSEAGRLQFEQVVVALEAELSGE